MTEITAQQKFTCPACGAQALWNPSKKKLVCPFCGTESAAELKSDGSLIEEQDLLAALRSMPAEQRGWIGKKKTVRCQSCNAISVFDEKRVAQNCDFCGSPSLIAVEEVQAPIRPSSQLAFHVPDTQVREQIRAWYGSHWLAPNKLKSKALTDTLHGVYIPYWTFDSQVDCPWDAQAGYYYYVRNSQGKQERRVRWEPAAGRIQHFFDDVLVPASTGIGTKLLHGIEPFPTTDQLLPYDPGYLQGWVVEQYQIDVVGAERLARTRMEATLRELCAREIPGDTYQNLRIHPSYSDQTFKHVLLPVWLLTYTYGTKNYQVAVNGYTGKISGDYPLSWVKITLLVILAIIVAVVFMYFNESAS